MLKNLVFVSCGIARYIQIWRVAVADSPSSRARLGGHVTVIDPMVERVSGPFNSSGPAARAGGSYSSEIFIFRSLSHILRNNEMNGE